MLYQGKEIEVLSKKAVFGKQVAEESTIGKGYLTLKNLSTPVSKG